MGALYLVDSSIFVFKAWHGLPDTLCNRRGEPNNAWLGFTDFVHQLLTVEKPRELVFAFDRSLRRSLRNEIYPAYKANRPPAPEELKRQFRWCEDWVRALGWSAVSSSRYEADDLIGSLAERHRSDERHVVILTADKDLAQLVRERDLWWNWHGGQQRGYRAVHRHFGVRPEQIADQLALAGDKVDNIPGIPGIGMTIAGRLLNKFGDLDNLRRNLGEVEKMKFRGALRVARLLREHESVLDISSRLTPVFCDAPEVADTPIGQGEIDVERIERMMEEQRMGAARRRSWRCWIERQRARIA
jgi:5'-3' exonuclease